MRNIFYSKSIDARIAFIRSYFTSTSLTKLSYLVPKKFMNDVAAKLPEATLHSYEDVTKSNDLFNNADSDTLLVFDRPSRYKNITSNIFVRLSRLSAKYEHRVMVDIVPFTAGIEFLYAPLAFIDRDILGYQHWYSYRENNWEQTDRGERVRAHDVQLLASKLAKVAEIDYVYFLENNVRTIECPLSKEETAGYKVMRDQLFAANTTASPIITALADWTNICESRYAILETMLRDPVRTIIYTNLSGHNKRILKRFKNVEVKTFYDSNGDEGKYDRVILFETPIVRGYLFLDVLANIRPDCNVYVFKSDTTVDKLLYNRMFDEFTQNNRFTKALYEEVHGENRK